MKKMIMMMVLLCFVCGAANAKKKKDEEQGTSTAELAALQLPAPDTLKVAVLPFWDVKSEPFNVRTASATSWLFFEREGFTMVPLLDSFDATAKDTELEPGLALRGTDAVRVGKSLGADWVVYGEVKELEKYSKGSFWGNRDIMRTGLRIAVANTQTNQIFYWKSRSETFNRKGKKFDTSVRKIILLTGGQILKPLFEAMPTHPANEKGVGTDDVAELVNRNWPATK